MVKAVLKMIFNYLREVKIGWLPHFKCQRQGGCLQSSPAPRDGRYETIRERTASKGSPIPARAGNRALVSLFIWSTTVHPRPCGEQRPY